MDTRHTTIDEIARLLPQRNGQLGRLLWRHAGGSLHRGMASVLGTLGDGPQTIGGLANREGVAQPTVTRMVERLESDGFVRRSRSQDDGRVVLVELTPRGAAELAKIRERYAAVLKDKLAGLSDEQLQTLLESIDALQVMIETLRKDSLREGLDPDAASR